MNKEVKIIYSLQLMQYLVEHGCELLEIKQHPTIKSYKCFVFSNTEELRELMERYSKESR